MKYYHFTSVENAQSINKEGLKAQSLTKTKTYDNHKIREIKKNLEILAGKTTELNILNNNSVFLTKDLTELRNQIIYKYNRKDYDKLITIYEVDSKYIDEDKTDFQKDGNLIVYSDDIPPQALTNTWTVSVKDAITEDFR